MCRIFVLQDVGSDCASDTAHIVIREVVGDNAAPAVGAEFDGSVVIHWSSVGCCRDTPLLTIVIRAYSSFSRPDTLRSFLRPVLYFALFLKSPHSCLQPLALLFLLSLVILT